MTIVAAIFIILSHIIEKQKRQLHHVITSKIQQSDDYHDNILCYLWPKLSDH